MRKEGAAYMSLTADAVWLNSVFAGYDQTILRIAHKLAELAGSVLTPLTKLVTLLGEKGILFFLLALLLMLFPRFRRTGICIFGAVCCGALITNIILKDHVARPRPFESMDLYRQWWEYVGAPFEDGFSFPSGHVTAAAAGVTGLCLMRGKRWVLPGLIWILLMMFSRNYLMAHYPSDVLFALLIGIFSGFVAAIITQLIFRFLENRRGDSAVCDFLLDTGIGSSVGRGSFKKENEDDEPASIKSELKPKFDDGEPLSNQNRKRNSARTSDKTSKKTGAYVPKH